MKKFQKSYDFNRRSHFKAIKRAKLLILYMHTPPWAWAHTYACTHTRIL